MAKSLKAFRRVEAAVAAMEREIEALAGQGEVRMPARIVVRPDKSEIYFACIRNMQDAQMFAGIPFASVECDAQVPEDAQAWLQTLVRTSPAEA